MRAAAEAHPDKKIALWFQDEARVGQKGRTGHRWWIKGQRPPGLADKRFASAYIFAAVRPATGENPHPEPVEGRAGPAARVHRRHEPLPRRFRPDPA